MSQGTGRARLTMERILSRVAEKAESVDLHAGALDAVQARRSRLDISPFEDDLAVLLQGDAGLTALQDHLFRSLQDHAPPVDARLGAMGGGGRRGGRRWGRVGGYRACGG